MKRFTSYLLVIALVISCFATVFVTTASAEATVISVGKSYTISPECNWSYWGDDPDVCKDDGTRLTDGSKSNAQGFSSAYAAWNASSVEIVVDLGSAAKSNIYNVYAAGGEAGIGAPSSITVSYSSDNSAWSTVSASCVKSTIADTTSGLTYDEYKGDGLWDLTKLTVTAPSAINVQYIKFTVTGAGSLIWLDEVEVAYDASADTSGDSSVTTGSEPSSGCNYSLSVTPRDDYPDSGYLLTDGSKSNPAPAGADGAKYVGFNTSGNLEIVLNLGSAKETDTYTLYTAQNFYGVWVPSNLAVSYSATETGVYTALTGTVTSTKVGDGTAYTSASGASYTPELYTVTFNSDTVVNAQYIKLTITPNGSYVWLDEVEASLNTFTSTGSNYTFSLAPRDDYPDGNNKLTNGSRSNPAPAGADSSKYVGFNTSTPIDIVLDLGETAETDTYTLYTAQNFYGVWIPDGLAVSYSDTADGTFTSVAGTVASVKVGDGTAYTSAGGASYTPELYTVTFTADEAVSARYIKLTVTPSAKSNYIWLDEVSATKGAVVNAVEIKSTDAGESGNNDAAALRVHHVDKAAGTNEISVFNTLDKISTTENGWGAYYQLRATVNPNEFTVVDACNNPMDPYYAAGTAFTSTEFLAETGFTTPSKWNLPSGIYDIYMVVKGSIANASVYELEVGDMVTFTNLTLTAGDYTDTYITAGAASGTYSGMINNGVEDTNLVHTIANVQVVDASGVSSALSADNAPNDAFFSGSGLDYNAILKACVANSVLPTIQIDSASDATSLISAMKATGCYDVNVTSSSAAVLTQIRAATKIARTGLIYNLTKSNLTSDEANTIRAAVRSAPATFVVFNSTNVSKQVVAELQELGVAVWVKIDTAAGTDAFNVEAVNTLTTGVNGIITASASEVTTLINTHFENDTMTRTPSVVGHRGYPMKATENTLDSFKAAYEYGADIFELDIYTTTDGGLVLFHDYSFGTAAGLSLTTFTGTASEGAIENMTTAQVKAITYKDGTPITFFDEVLDYFKDKDIRIFIEYKGSGLERTVKYTAQAVKNYGMEDKVCVISSAGSYLAHNNTYFDSGVSVSYVYANNSLSGYAPQDTPEWSYANTREENLSVLAYALSLSQSWNANLSPACGAVSLGYRTAHYMGESTTNRGLVLNPWTYGSAWNNNIGFFSNVDSITTDVVDWFTDMAKYVSAEDVTLVAGQTYTGAGFTATTYGRETVAIDSDDIVYSIISGDSVEVQNGKLVAVKDGETKLIMGYKTKTSSDAAYVLYSDVVTVTVDSDNADVLKPLIALAETMTVKDFNETDLQTLRQLHATACTLVNTGSTDSTAISETAIALTALLEKRYDNCISDIPVTSYTTTEPNYYKWANGGYTDELHPDYADDGKKLIDGIKSSEVGYSAAYSAWIKTGSVPNVEITLDLGASASSNIYNAYFAYGVDGVAIPAGMTVSYKTVSGEWKMATGTLTSAVVSDTSSWDLYKLTFTSDEVINSQYVKLTVEPNNFVWVDEVEVQYAAGGQVSGDFIYINGFDTNISNGDSHIFTSGTITTSNGIAYTMNIVAEWSDYYNAYTVVSVTEGTGTDTPAIELKEGQILIAVHDWETNVTDGSAVIGSAANMTNARNVKEGQLLKAFGVNVSEKSLGIAPYVRFIDSDHTCEDNGDGWITDETNHWHECGCGQAVDEAPHIPGAEADCENAQVCTVCGRIIEYELGHNYEWVVTKEAGVDVEGLNECICTVCGYVDGTEVIPALHEAASDEWNANSENHWHECGCGKIVDRAPHTPGAEADCENAQICTVCGYEITAALGHDYEWVVTKEAEIGVEGLEENTCTVCGDVVETEVIPALEEDVFLGDVNLNGEIDSLDYILLKRAYFNTFALNDQQQKNGDINQNGEIDSLDYILLKRAYFGTYVITKK